MGWTLSKASKLQGQQNNFTPRSVQQNLLDFHGAPSPRTVIFIIHSFPMIKHSALLSDSSRANRGATGIHILLFHYQNTYIVLRAVLSSCELLVVHVCHFHSKNQSVMKVTDFCFPQGTLSGKSFISFLTEGALEQMTDYLCQTHCTSTCSMYGVP